ncbi:MAG TPA: acyl-ACP--UDP-N-acetylglucosamine O-acyltransferase [Phycisphaerales bacterium]|nr:acyl-ACP--UDP-N-acetylglucosamine O-acyltransferase [Phycisphaerales bacterium]
MPDATARIDPGARVEDSVKVGAGAEVGPGCVLRGDVTLGAGVRLINHVSVQGPVTIGDNTTVYPGACIGFEPQDVKFKPGMPTAGVKIGRNNLIREHVTIHAASKTAHPTTVGDNCMLMVNSHLGHDTVIGDNVILVNGCLLAGHVRVGNNATLSGNTAVHQFCRVGRLAFVSGGVVNAMDVPPFCVSGARNTVNGLNVVGLRRSGVSRSEIDALRRVYRDIFRERIPREEMIERMRPLAAESALVREFMDFIADRTGKAICSAHADEDAEAEAIS